MTTIVWGHGTRSRGEEKTFVPDGTTIKWFADLDENLLTRNGFLALSSGDFGAPNDSQGPGDGTNVEVFNYEVSEDLVKRDRVAILHRGGETLEFVGAEVAEGPLCPTPDECKTNGSHNCSGLLGTVHDSEIVILVCRGLPGSDTGTEAFGSDARTSDIGEDFKEWFDRWVLQVQADPDATMAAYGEYSDPVKIQLATYIAVEQWQALHWASVYAASGAAADAMTQFRSLSDAGSLTWFLNNIPVYPQRFSALVKSNPSEFATALGQAAQGVQDALATIPDVAGLLRLGGADQAHSDFSAQSWVPDEQEIAGTTEINRSTVKDAGDGDALDFTVAGFVLLIGDQHGQNWVDWAATNPDHASGTITVKRATFGAGRFDVAGCPPAKQAIVERELKSFSDKDVRFV